MFINISQEEKDNMKKGQRPSKHYRHIKTKRGTKKIVVNRNIRKRFKKSGTVEKTERKIFSHISDPKEYYKEYGGAIDFDKKGRIEQINVSPGSEYDIELPPDYEVQYHTHPAKELSPPTPEDVLALLQNKRQQAEVVFSNGKAYVIIKTPSTRALSKLPATQLFNKLDRAFLLSQGPNWDRKWKQKLEGMGFIVYINDKKEGKLDIPIRPVEPKKKKKRRS